MLESWEGITITAISNPACKAQDKTMPRTGNRPVCASPARGSGDFDNAGRMAVRNSSQGDDHSTKSLGASVNFAQLSSPKSQSYRQFQSASRVMCWAEAPIPMRLSGALARPAKVSVRSRHEALRHRYRDKLDR